MPERRHVALERKWDARHAEVPLLERRPLPRHFKGEARGPAATPPASPAPLGSSLSLCRGPARSERGTAPAGRGAEEVPARGGRRPPPPPGAREGGREGSGGWGPSPSSLRLRPATSPVGSPSPPTPPPKPVVVSADLGHLPSLPAGGVGRSRSRA